MTHPARQFQGERAANLFSPLAFAPDCNLFQHDDQTLGYGFLCTPLAGADSSYAERLSVLLNQDWPAGTQMQVALWSTPDIDQALAVMLGLRLDLDPGVLREATQERAQFLRTGVSDPIIPGTEVRVRDLRVFVGVKVPIAAMLPNAAEIAHTNEHRAETEQMLSTAGLRPQPLTAEDYVRLLGTLLNWGEDASWRHRIAPECDPTRILREQLLDYDHGLEVDADGLTLGETRVQVLSCKRYPDQVHFGLAARYLGDPLSGTRGIRHNALVTLNLYFPDQERLRSRMKGQRQWATNTAYGPLAKFMPELVSRKQGFDALFAALDQGDRPVQCYLSLVLFSSPAEAAAVASNAITYWRELGFQLMRDRFFVLPLFLQALPFGMDRRAIRDMMRYRTLAARHAVTLLPVFGDWKGTPTPVVNLLSRSGQLMNLSLFDSTSNYNAVVAASSGAGKSFFTNELIASSLSAGARCWIVDVGRSYQKLCEALGGQFIAFQADSDLCINPFELVQRWEEEADVVLAIITAMAAPTEPLGDYRTAGLKRVLKQVWDALGPKMTVDAIADALLREDDPRVQDIGRQLFAFTSQGEYGRFFNGTNSIRFTAPLVVLELEELKSRRHLQQVVLLQLIYQIQQAMYLGERGQQKLVVIDEAWDLLTQGDVGRFIESGYRRFRKYGGAAVTVTQSLADLYANPVGRAIAENSANTFLLAQPSQNIDQLAQEKRLPIPVEAAELLKTVHTVPGAYSEIFCLTTMGGGIGRLVVDPFRRLLYSTAPQDVAALESLRQQGLDVVGAIRRLLWERGHG
ncbi:type IV secretion system protein TraC [Thiorhodovibrio frisius]|uniref:type IV secretion system protein TraC n=1 Tax=Thiorhodovibrio frisius TaxID=631362 RepID=UPI002B26369B|nr:type IV secretion system protein TraC [Thiorhodovibrio frisius]WPL22944.1 conjugal transfer ATP-binding protein TraC [Thiorhodovibrio frisius]